MRISHFVKEKGRYAVSVCVVMLTLSVVIFHQSLRRPDEPTPVNKVYYYDLNTSSLFVATEGPSSIETASGPFENEPAGVRAYVYACRGQGKEDQHFIGYLEKLDAQGRGAAVQPVSVRSDMNPHADTERDRFVRGHKFIRREADNQWVAPDSNDGQAILTELYAYCDGKAAVEVRPTEMEKP